MNTGKYYSNESLFNLYVKNVIKCSEIKQYSDDIGTG